MTPRSIHVSLAQEVRLIAALVPGPDLDVGALDITGHESFASAFDVDTAAFTAAALANLAFGVSAVDRARVVALFSGAIELDGQPVPQWADLSGYYRTADGRMVQLHCNFPHHAAGVVARLGCDHTRESVETAIATRTAHELETELIADGMIAACVRTLDEWEEHPHALATSDLPLISVERMGDAPPRDPDRRLRVLDCSRVLAGPVAGMTFAAHGADVLLVGAAHLPSVDIGVLATGFGKRNAFVDLDTPAGHAHFTRLLETCDVWIDSYRPGAFATRGFTSRSAPGAVTVQVSAFDWTGPWADRRGFDSIVQSTTGIVDAGTCASGSTGPVPLPVQALDFCTGLLAAFAGRQLVAHQAVHGGTWLARLSLLRTRNWLLSLRGAAPFTPARPVLDPAARASVETPFGHVTAARPIGGHFTHGPQPLGSSAPEWLI
ncbi:MAG: CoA transferase [Acidimicrobiia bacterium]